MNKQYNLLDKGWVRIDDYMGTDRAIVEIFARTSYSNGTKTLRDDERLINFLMEHQHGTPFEMPVIKFEVKCPIFVARQWFRHRVASYNEMSARYSEVLNEYYIPKKWRVQSKKNKQSSVDGDLNHEALAKEYIANCEQTFNTYQQMLKQGVAREQARMILPQSTYTIFYCQMNLRSLLNFLQLRCVKNAQAEIVVYADALLDFVKEWLPLTYDAFDNHVLNTVKFSRDEIETLQQIVELRECDDRDILHKRPNFSDTQWQRFLNKLKIKWSLN